MPAAVFFVHTYPCHMILCVQEVKPTSTRPDSLCWSDRMSCLCVPVRWETLIRRCYVASEDRTGQGLTKRATGDKRASSFSGRVVLVRLWLLRKLRAGLRPGMGGGVGGVVSRGPGWLHWLGGVLHNRHCWQNTEKEFRVKGSTRHFIFDGSSAFGLHLINKIVLFLCLKKVSFHLKNSISVVVSCLESSPSVSLCPLHSLVSWLFIYAHVCNCVCVCFCVSLWCGCITATDIAFCASAWLCMHIFICAQLCMQFDPWVSLSLASAALICGGKPIP